MILLFEEKPVRFVGTAERPEWVGADVCAALEIRNARDALAGVPEDEKGVAIADTLGGNQSVTTVYEPGLYRLIFKSRKPVAERFRKWVFSEVLPGIRKTGSYSVPAPAESGDPLLNSIRLIQQAAGSLAELREKQVLFERQQAATHRLAECAQRTADAALAQAENNHGYFQVLGFARLLGMELSEPQASAHGRGVAQYCRENGLEIRQQRHPRYGHVNTYPETALRAYFQTADSSEPRG